VICVEGEKMAVGCDHGRWLFTALCNNFWYAVCLWDPNHL